MSRRFLPALLSITLVLLAAPALADEESVPGMYPLAVAMSVVNAGLTVTNAIMWAEEGSIATGSLGIVIGALTIPLAIGSRDELGDTNTAWLVGAASVGVITGVGAMLHGMHTRDASKSRIDIEPTLGINQRKPTIGLQFIARW